MTNTNTFVRSLTMTCLVNIVYILVFQFAFFRISFCNALVTRVLSVEVSYARAYHHDSDTKHFCMCWCILDVKLKPKNTVSETNLHCAEFAKKVNDSRVSLRVIATIKMMLSLQWMRHALTQRLCSGIWNDWLFIILHFDCSPSNFVLTNSKHVYVCDLMKLIALMFDKCSWNCNEHNNAWNKFRIITNLNQMICRLTEMKCSENINKSFAKINNLLKCDVYYSSFLALIFFLNILCMRWQWETTDRRWQIACAIESNVWSCLR